MPRLLALTSFTRTSLSVGVVWSLWHYPVIVAVVPHYLPRLPLWSDTRFTRAHALYSRLGFVRTGERALPGDVNQTREYRYDLDL